ncbi:MAG: ferredoxin [Bacteroidia bacterium]|nr:ferredoxin [Bacteroidia bacterium]
MIQISQHRKKCIGCNACVEAAPGRWVISQKDGKSTLVGGSVKKDMYVVNVHDDEWEENSKAAEVCPVRIIRLKTL